ncbi:hypothetical protein [Ohtaekwangia sp.]|uniref:hypothetical protein n=1 Tax=Ohtaekwangia sp. TaxID=2066019 RepID=UPI002F954D6D
MIKIFIALLVIFIIYAGYDQSPPRKPPGFLKKKLSDSLSVYYFARTAKRRPVAMAYKNRKPFTEKYTKTLGYSPRQAYVKMKSGVKKFIGQ